MTATITVQAPQVITFSLPASGLVGGTVSLSATADSGLPVGLAVTTPSLCSITATTLHLNADGACTVTASQPGDATHAPAPDATATIRIKLPPLTTPGGTSLGRYAFNGPIRAMTVDPETGTAYVGGDFTQIGIRTGTVAMVDPPGSGSDRLRDTSPDVIGDGSVAFADDATGYFLFGAIELIAGAGVPWWAGVRMTADGAVDQSWHMTMPCTITMGTPSWDIGDQLVAGIPASPDAVRLVHGWPGIHRQGDRSRRPAWRWLAVRAPVRSSLARQSRRSLRWRRAPGGASATGGYPTSPSTRRHGP